MGEMRITHKIVGNAERKRPLRKFRRRWEDNIRMDVDETECKGVDLIHVAHDRDQWRAPVKTVMNLRIP